MNTKDPRASERSTRTKAKPVFTENQSAFTLNDLALAATSAGDHEQAVEYFRQAINESSEHAFIFSNYALSLRDIGRFSDAIKILKKAIALDAENSIFLFNLGNIQFEIGLVREAMASYEQALRAKPGFPELLCNYALVALGAQEIALAQRLARRGLSECPPDHPLKVRFAIALSGIDSILGHTKAALARLEQFIEGDDREEALYEYVRILANAAPEDLSTESLRHVSDLLLNKWSAPEQIAYPAWRSVIKDHGLPQAPMTRAWSQLALLLLSSTIIPDVNIEDWLSQQRRYLLTLDDEACLSDHDIEFFSALAQQCYHRNYLFQDDAGSLPDLGELRTRIERQLEESCNPPILWILQYACRVPLAVLNNAPILLSMASFAPHLKSLFRQQIENPLLEKAIEATIPIIFSVPAADDEVVERYSNYPYPQWTWPGRLNRPEHFNIYLTKRLEHTNFNHVGDANFVRVLVAGCGTGRHSHLLACILTTSQIKAIDISRASLAFATRQAIENKITNIEYIDADIMQLGHWTERFEVIECAGVLHHLSDPEAGLMTLLKLLKPNGVILLGLYSRRARSPLTALRARIEPLAKTDVIAALHSARAIAKTDPAFSSILSYREFFSLNGCLDLILHPRETSYDPLEIAEILHRHGLIFRGFELSNTQRASFRMRNRRPEDLLNLTIWDTHEIENPDTFAGMYQFWAQKPPLS